MKIQLQNAKTLLVAIKDLLESVSVKIYFNKMYYDVTYNIVISITCRITVTSRYKSTSWKGQMSLCHGHQPDTIWRDSNCLIWWRIHLKKWLRGPLSRVPKKSKAKVVSSMQTGLTKTRTKLVWLRNSLRWQNRETPCLASVGHWFSRISIN